MDDPERRYEEIMRRLAASKKPSEPPARQKSRDDLARILDGLNAWGALQGLQEREWPDINCYGPRAFNGAHPTPWVGVAIWYKPRGYFYYKTLHLLGIWAVEDAGGIQVIVGTKTLDYSAPVFNAEPYYRLIKHKFDVYYKDDGSPPPEDNRLFSATYDAARRLTLRRKIEQTLDEWAAASS